MSIYQAISELFNLIQFLIFFRVLLTWFPNIDWYKQPFKLLNDITEPILEPFRRLIPPIGGLDISPIVALLVVQLVSELILSMIHF